MSGTSVYTHITKIPKNSSEFFKEEISKLSLPNPYSYDIYISNISVTVDTTSLWNIRTINTIQSSGFGNLNINPGYYKIETLQTILIDYFTITDNSTTAKVSMNLSKAPCIKKIFFIESDSIEAGTVINKRYDISGGLSVIRVFSDIVKSDHNHNSLVDIPIYVSQGLDNTLTLSNLCIPINTGYNTKYITFWLRNIYNEIIVLNSDLFISWTITCIPK